MHELGVIIGRSPRATKRFVNTYRLLRATDERLRFDFRETMLLLATITGVPDLVPLVVGRSDSGEQSEIVFDDAFEQRLRAHENQEQAGRLLHFMSSPEAAAWKQMRLKNLRAARPRVAQFSFSECGEN